MNQAELAELLRQCPPGKDFFIPYDVFDDIWPPGMPDMGAKNQCWIFANSHGFSARDNPAENAIVFTRRGLCPVCGETLENLRSATSDRTYSCPKHGLFRVTGSSEAVGFWAASISDQQRAYEAARVRASARPDGIPVIIFDP